MTIDLNMLQGYKTYLGIAIAILAVLAVKFLGITIPGMTVDPNNWVTTIWELIMVGFGRSAIAKVETP